MARTDLAVGASATASIRVRESDLATAFTPAPSDVYPPVFATARMIALMEVASARALVPLLEEGELSVGVHVDVVHNAATPVGVTVTADARFIGMEGRIYKFEVVARDPGGEIGRGTHQRAIIKTQRLIDGARKRCNL